MGFLVAGPKSLNFFGSYVSEGTVNQILDGGSDQPIEGSLAGSTPVDGAIGLFLPQLASLSISVVGLMAISIAIVMLSVLRILRTRELSPASALSLLSLIWLITLMVEISLFTGWITGLGDDHTNRILIRYYDFMLLIVPLSALAAAGQDSLWENKSFLRWGLVLLLSIPLTSAFTSHFAALEIQIADAPNLAGLVVNETVFSSVATVSLIGLVAIAAFPRSAKYVLVATFPLMMIATGWQIQDQYENFRGEKSAADLAGQYVNENFSSEEMSEITILANSRFDATNAGFWMDVPDIRYEVPSPGILIPVDFFPEERRILLIIGDYQVQGEFTELQSNENFRILDARPGE